MIGETKDARSTLSRAFSCGLGEQINASSRSLHFILNRLIVNRLPLALPPNAIDPSIYIFGLLRIAPLYVTFESIWESFLDTKSPSITVGISCDCNTCDHRSHCVDAPDPAPTYHGQACLRIRSLLAHLHLPDLLRSVRIRADIRSACHISDVELDEHFKRILEYGEVADFIKHIRKSAETNPHVLLAYAWIFYMALFSGGRFIRATLRAAGLEFWKRVPVSDQFCFGNTSDADVSSLCSDKIGKSPTESPLLRNFNTHALGVDRAILFFSFADDTDGDDIKLEFKKRFAEVNTHLTVEEKEAIVYESQVVFKYLIEIVKGLDRDIEQRILDPLVDRLKSSKNHCADPLKATE